MAKKVLAYLLAALLLVMPLTQALADETEDNVDKVIAYIEEKIQSLGSENAVKLLDVLKKLHEDQVIDEFFNKLDDGLESRLAGKGFSSTRLSAAANLMRGDGFYTATKQFINGELNKDDYKNYLKNEFDKIFKESEAPLKTFYDSAADDYGRFKNFLVALKNLELNILGLNTRENPGFFIDYIIKDGNVIIRIDQLNSTAGLMQVLNDFLPDDLQLTEAETASLIKAINFILENLEPSEAEALKTSLENMAYYVNEAELPDDKYFHMTAAPLVRANGLKAVVDVIPVAGGYPEDEVVLFQLMKETTPISIVAVEKDIASPEQVIAYFSVNDYYNPDYKVMMFVFDRFDSNISAPINLAEPIERQ